MNLLAITNSPTSQIKRIQLDAQTQSSLSGLLQNQIYEFNTLNPISFNSSYKPDEDECLVINPYTDLFGIVSALQNPTSLPILTINAQNLADIRAIFFGDSTGSSAYLQNFSKKNVISNSGFSLFNDNNVFKKISQESISLPTKVCAKLEHSQLSLRSFHLARQFLDLKNYYLIATNSDINAFAQCTGINISNPQAFINECDEPARKKIWSILNSAALDQQKIQKIIIAANRAKLTLTTTTANGLNTIHMPSSRKEIKLLLDLMDSNILESPIDNKMYRTNSKTPLP